MMPSYRVEASPSSAVPHACIAQPLSTNQARDKQQQYSTVPIDTYTAVYHHDRNAAVPSLLLHNTYNKSGTRNTHPTIHN
eukprot:11805608-Ditylum_brightwellii.AAC.1